MSETVRLGSGGSVTRFARHPDGAPAFEIVGPRGVDVLQPTDHEREQLAVLFAGAPSVTPQRRAIDLCTCWHTASEHLARHGGLKGCQWCFCQAFTPHPQPESAPR